MNSLHSSSVCCRKLLIVHIFAKTTSLFVMKRWDGHGMTSSSATWHHSLRVGRSFAVTSQSAAWTWLFKASARRANTRLSCSRRLGAAAPPWLSTRSSNMIFAAVPGGKATSQPLRSMYSSPAARGARRHHLRGTAAKLPQTRSGALRLSSSTASSAWSAATSSRPPLSMAATALRSLGSCTHSTMAPGMCSYPLQESPALRGSSRRP
mmetsp:Transcript_102147/g.329333  ORF Transcript_102147/g.329333 Transcript_102147/m.329333 type:complete len:208 (+) Transcript_102147:100-723(+)